MATLVFVLVFVLLGVSVLLVALAGGRGGARGGRELESKTRGRRRLAIGAFVLALVGLGVGVPAAVIGSVHNRSSDPRDNIANLTPSEKAGRQIFGQQCRVCHSLKAAGAYAQVGPDLDVLRPPKALVLDAIEHGRARGNGQMGAQLVIGQDAQDVAAFVAKAVGKSGQK